MAQQEGHAADDFVVIDPEDFVPPDPPIVEAHAQQPPPPVQPAEPVEVDAPLPEFDPRYAEALQGLLFLGYLTEDFTWAGHSFKIKTLNTDEILETALLAKEWSESMAAMKALQTATVAAAVELVDGQAVAIPLTDFESPIAAKFNVVKRWFPPTIDAIYERCLLLESEVERVLAAMGVASGKAVG